MVDSAYSPRVVRRPLGISVLEAAQQRIAYVFDNFPRIYVSFSGGKDSTVMLHLVMEEAIRRGRRVSVLFIDLEGQYKITIDHVRECLELYRQHIEPFWVCLPLHLRNAVSQYQPHWICWDKDDSANWVRPLPGESISDETFFPFFRHGMEFEEFIEYFGGWYGQGQLTACCVGIRTQESLNRWRTIAKDRTSRFEGLGWTTWKGGSIVNVYPIYDWKTEDDWIYLGKSRKAYNRLYDYMWKAGLTIHQMRICQPYGDDQRKGLWLFHLIEPETWGRIVSRVAGANHGALYIQESSNMLGNIKISKPPGHTWESFSILLLGSMPERTSLHFKNKIAVFLQWYRLCGFPNGIPDDGTLEKGSPNWKRICKMLLRNDYWAKGLSFTQHKSSAYEKYLEVMKNRRQRWGIFPNG